MRIGYAGLAALLIFAAGIVAGYYLPHRFEESIARSKIQFFHQCIAPLRQARYTHDLSWDAAAEQRAFGVLATMADCTNRSGIGGLSVGEVECASGYSAMPYDAFGVTRTHRKRITPGYCAGR